MNEYKLKPDYLKQITDVIEWPESMKDISEAEKIQIGLLIQMNIQMSRLFDVMRIATGLTEEDDVENLSHSVNPVNQNIEGENPSLANIDVPEDIDNRLEVAMGKSVVCGSCGKGVVPTAMGYCPNKKCGFDLKAQIAQYLINGGK